jgi:hypothetical protein
MVPPDAAVVDFRAFLPADRLVRIQRSTSQLVRRNLPHSANPTPTNGTVRDVYAGCRDLSPVAVPRRDQEWPAETGCESGINMKRNRLADADGLRKVRDPARDRRE